MDHYRTQAIAAYKRKDYQTAVQQYTKAIKHAESAQLYDDRAACHVKIGDLKSALKDVKLCLNLAPLDPAGYLRAGIVLTKMNQQDAALDVMARGLKKVKHAGKSFDMLRSTYNQLLSTTRPTKSIDPMTMLPRELAFNILEQLSFQQRTAVSTVSKGWYDLIKNEPKFWRCLDFSKAQARRKIPYSFIVHAVKYSKGHVKSVILHNMWDMEKSLAVLLRHCRIEHIRFQMVPKLGDGIVDLLLAATHLHRLEVIGQCLQYRVYHALLDQHASRLQSCTATVSGHGIGRRLLTMPHMQELSLTLQDAFAPVKLSSIAQQLPDLISLTVIENSPSNHLHDYSMCSQLQHISLQLSNTTISSIMLPTSLLTISLHKKSSSALDDALDEWPLYITPILESLDLNIGYGITLSILEQKLFHQTYINPSQPTRLRSFSYTGCSFTGVSLSSLEIFCKHPSLKDLQHIGFPTAYDWQDEYVTVLARCFLSLRSIDLSSTTVTGVGIKAALEAKNIDRLVLNECHSVGLDAIQWARSKGITVQHKLSDAQKYERKIRYH